MTLGQAVAAARARLEAAGVAFGHGTTNAHDEAVWLVLWRLGLPLDDYDGVAARELDGPQQRAIEALVDERIRRRVPAAYLTREAWLQGVPFSVDERAIVPRSLLAEPLAEGVLDAWLRREPARVLDLCTGNGSLAVLAALAWPGAVVEASDIDADALEVARLNVARHGLAARLRLRCADGLAGATGPYDLVLCNPPYVDAQAMAALPAEYRAEPARALAGGADGMDFVRSLLAGAAPLLAPGGLLVVEIGQGRAAFERAFPALQPVWLATSAGDDAVVLLTREALRDEAAP